MSWNKLLFNNLSFANRNLILHTLKEEHIDQLIKGGALNPSIWHTPNIKTNNKEEDGFKKYYNSAMA
jgi:hypothetical protein